MDTHSVLTSDPRWLELQRLRKQHADEMASRPTILIALQGWAAHHDAVHAAHEKLHALTGAAPTCPLSAPAFAVLQAFTEYTVGAIGDRAGILDWWVKDAQCKPADVEWPVGTHRHIAGLSDLAELIAEAGA